MRWYLPKQIYKTHETLYQLLCPLLSISIACSLYNTDCMISMHVPSNLTMEDWKTNMDAKLGSNAHNPCKFPFSCYSLNSITIICCSIVVILLLTRLIFPSIWINKHHNLCCLHASYSKAQQQEFFYTTKIQIILVNSPKGMNCAIKFPNI